MTTLVVLPTYNEAETIVDVLRRIRAAVDAVDVLVVDDSSPDGTADLVEATALEIGRVEVLRRPGKAGLGSAYRAGFSLGLQRGYAVLIEMDADLSHDPATLPSLIAAVKSGGADLAIGTRYMPGGSIPDWPWYRRAISRLGCFYARFALRMCARDATSGFRAYTREALEQIDLERVRAEGYGFQVEMAYLVERNGGRLAEVPIEFRDRTLGHSKMSPRIVAEALVLVTWWGLRGRLRREFPSKRREDGRGLSALSQPNGAAGRGTGGNLGSRSTQSGSGVGAGERALLEDVEGEETQFGRLVAGLGPLDEPIEDALA